MPRITPLKKRKWIKFLLYIGCTFSRFESGDHIVYDRPGLTRPVIFTDDKEISINLIMSNLRTLGTSREEYLEIIQNKI